MSRAGEAGVKGTPPIPSHLVFPRLCSDEKGGGDGKQQDLLKPCPQSSRPTQPNSHTQIACWRRRGRRALPPSRFPQARGDRQTSQLVSSCPSLARSAPSDPGSRSYDSQIPAHYSVFSGPPFPILLSKLPDKYQDRSPYPARPGRETHPIRSHVYCGAATSSPPHNILPILVLGTANQ